MYKSIKSVKKRMTIVYRNVKGEIHKIDGPAIVKINGTEEWWMNGKRHREDGPALTRKDGTKIWWVHGKCHRTDGPAIIWADGATYWYLNDKEYSETEYNFWKEFK